MFTISGAIIRASITSIVEPRFLYFFFAAFLSTSFLGVRKHIHQPTPITPIRPDRLAKWLELKGVYYDQSINTKIDYKVIRPIPGGAGMVAAGSSRYKHGCQNGKFA